MTQRTETFLDRIVADKRAELEATRLRVPFDELKARLSAAPPERPFGDALRGGSLRLIAAAKKGRASPAPRPPTPGLRPGRLGDRLCRRWRRRRLRPHRREALPGLAGSPRRHPRRPAGRASPPAPGSAVLP